jgi:hypothetical protein
MFAEYFQGHFGICAQGTVLCMFLRFPSLKKKHRVLVVNPCAKCCMFWAGFQPLKKITAQQYPSSAKRLCNMHKGYQKLSVCLDPETDNLAPQSNSKSAADTEGKRIYVIFAYLTYMDLARTVYLPTLTILSGKVHHSIWPSPSSPSLQPQNPAAYKCNAGSLKRI